MPDVLDALRRWWQPEPDRLDSALVLSGGGARAAYQSGVLHYMAEAFPEAFFSLMLGVSAGAINMAHLANHTGALPNAVRQLTDTWLELRPEHVFAAESSFSLVRRLVGRSNGASAAAGIAHQAIVDTSPLRAFLVNQLRPVDGELKGIQTNLQRGRLKACALSATNYGTGQNVTWVEGRDIAHWERPYRRSVQTRLTVDHIMASTSLPLLFPAVRIGDAWYGDGGIRLSSPLSPVIHLGAHKILVISTRYDRSAAEADEPVTVGYPPAAQIMGVLMNAIFLDALDQDVRKLEQVNRLLERVPRRRWNGLRPIQALVLRPSKDIGRMASDHALTLPGALGWFMQRLGSGETKSPDWLSMLLFDRSYIEQLIELGRTDAKRQHDHLARFLDPKPSLREDP